MVSAPEGVRLHSQQKRGKEKRQDVNDSRGGIQSLANRRGKNLARLITFTRGGRKEGRRYQHG